MENKQIIEEYLNFSLPSKYLVFLNTLDGNPFEIPNTSVTLYPLNYLLERNITYDIQAFDPKACLIGQDGDLGFFIQQYEGEKVFELGLGALGSLDMRLKGKDINDFIEKIKADYIPDEYD